MSSCLNCNGPVNGTDDYCPLCNIRWRGVPGLNDEDFDLADFDDTGVELPPNFPTSADLLKRLEPPQ